MGRFGDAYRGSRERITELALSVRPQELTTEVPACPAWNVRDLVAHLAGVAADATAGNLAEAGQEQWTEVQVTTRKGRDLGSLLDEWGAAAAQLEPALDVVPPAMAGLIVADLVTHEHDARGALGRPGSRDSDAVEIGLDTYLRWLGRRLKERELPPLRVEVGYQSRTVGDGEPGATVEGEPFEVFRALSGRRTKEQIAALGWSGDAGLYLEVFSGYGSPKTALAE